MATTKEQTAPLNFDEIPEYGIVVGSAPLTSEHMESIIHDMRATGILCLQTDDCLKKLKINYDELSSLGKELGAEMVRVPMEDLQTLDFFDPRPNQIEMLPKAVYALYDLKQRHKLVYLHCNAGINRAPTVFMGLQTLLEGKRVEDSYEYLNKHRLSGPLLDVLRECRDNLAREALGLRHENSIPFPCLNPNEVSTLREDFNEAFSKAIKDYLIKKNYSIEKQKPENEPWI